MKLNKRKWSSKALKYESNIFKKRRSHKCISRIDLNKFINVFIDNLNYLNLSINENNSHILVPNINKLHNLCGKNIDEIIEMLKIVLNDNHNNKVYINSIYRNRDNYGYVLSCKVI